jgi:uncharacterized protein (DUF1330 family)
MTSQVIDPTPLWRQAPGDRSASRGPGAEERYMSTYAIAHMRWARLGPAIVEYLERIDATLAPFDGRFLAHGGKVQALEGQWSGDLIIIAFPDRAHASGWYQSAAYQAILPLRRDNTEGELIFIDAVASDHRATDILAA